MEKYLNQEYNLFEPLDLGLGKNKKIYQFKIGKNDDGYFVFDKWTGKQIKIKTEYVEYVNYTIEKVFPMAKENFVTGKTTYCFGYNQLALDSIWPGWPEMVEIEKELHSLILYYYNKSERAFKFQKMENNGVKWKIMV